MIKTFNKSHSEQGMRRGRKREKKSKIWTLIILNSIRAVSKYDYYGDNKDFLTRTTVLTRK